MGGGSRVKEIRESEMGLKKGGGCHGGRVKEIENVKGSWRMRTSNGRKIEVQE